MKKLEIFSSVFENHDEETTPGSLILMKRVSIQSKYLRVPTLWRKWHELRSV